MRSMSLFSQRGFHLACAALLVLGLTGPAARAAEPLPAGAVARARVRVLTGLYERADFKATLSLDAARLAGELPDAALPDRLHATAVDLKSGKAVPCELRRVASEPEAKLPRPDSVDVHFAVNGAVPVMGYRDFEIVLTTAGEPAGQVDLAPPFGAIYPVEVRVLSLEIAGKGAVCSIGEADKDNLVFNGSFDAETWQVDSVGPGWSARAFFYAGRVPVERVVEPQRGGVAQARHEGHPLGFVSAPFEVRPGARYRVSLSTRGDASSRSDPATAVNVMLRLAGPAGEDDRANRWDVNWPDLPLTEDWTSHARILAVPHGPRWGYLVVRAVTQSQFCLDDVKVEEVDALPASVVFDSERAFFAPHRDVQEGRSQDVVWDVAAKALTLRPVENLIADGDFEAEGAWSFSHPALFELSAEATWSGERGLLLKNPRGMANPPAVTVASRAVTLDPNTAYTLSLAYRATAGGSMTRVRLETDAQAILLDDVLPPWFQVKGNGWLRHRMTIPAGLAATKAPQVQATLSFIHETPPGKRPTSIDDVCLTEGIAAAPFSTGSTFPGTGEVVSAVIDLGPAGDPALNWTATIPEGTSVAFFTRTGPTPYYDETCWDAWRPVAKGAAIPTLGRGLDTWVQWKAVLRTTRADAAPQVQRVEVIRGNTGTLRSPRIRLTTLDNGEITQPALDWLAWMAKEEPLAEWLKEPGFVEMSETAKRVVAPFDDDFAQQMALINYFANDVMLTYGGPANSRYPAPVKPFTPLTYWRWYEASTRGEGNLMCAHFGIIHCALCRGAGIPARMLSLGSILGSGHNMSEVWSEKFQRWYFSDAEYGAILTLDGVPQSLQDLQDLYRRGEYDRVRTHHSASTRVPYMTFENAWGRMSEERFVGRSNKDTMSDILGTHLLAWTEERFDLFRYYIPEDALFMRDPHYTAVGDGKNTFTGGWFSEPERLRFKVNQVQFRFDVAGNERVTVRLRHSGWDFDHYEISIDGALTDRKADAFVWTLRPGANRISARTVSVQGHKGKAFTADLWLEPAE